MTHQLDMMPGAIAEAITDPVALEHAAEQLPKAREVEPRLPLNRVLDDSDKGHEMVLAERARQDHR